jgi:hypothetical protein
MSIASSSMLVELNISVWTGNKVDKTVTRQVTDDNSATTDAGQFRKNLTAGSSLRKELADYAAACRLRHNQLTMPWCDRGPRLLPTSMFFDYKQEFGGRQTYFEDKIARFVREYPVLQKQAQQALGAMFNPEDYPSVEAVRNKFGFNMVFSPVPESGDFRLDMPAQDLAAMRAHYDAAFDSRLADAMREPWDKLHKTISAMTDKLVKVEAAPDGTVTRWHDTFIGNAAELCKMLTHLNLTKDPKLEQARRDLEKAIAGVDIDDVKEDAGVRTDLKDKLNTMLKQYEW